MPSTLPRSDDTTAWQRERRELRELAETAATAAGGGITLSLTADSARPGRWRADVLSAAGGQVRVRMDATLGTAEVGTAARVALAA